MRSNLSFIIEYFGDCKDAIDLYTTVFDRAEAAYKTFKEMPMADALGISGNALDMIWQSRMRIPFGDSVLSLNLSDSVLVAMQNNMDITKPFYKPVICISHDDEDYIRCLFRKIYGDGANPVDILTAEVEDMYGICWKYQKCSDYGIHYCLSFDGFCGDVIAFYENVFGIRAAKVVKYGDSPYADSVSDAGKEMIFSATLCFDAGDCICSIMVQDSYDSAVSGVNSYDKNALLFYRRIYNPLFEFRDTNEEFLAEVFEKIKEGAKLNRPLARDDKGVLYGSLIDKYGICWNFYSADS